MSALPFFEQKQVQDKYNLTGCVSHAVASGAGNPSPEAGDAVLNGNGLLATTKLNVFICPSDPNLPFMTDAQAKAFTAQAKAKLEGIVALHYQRAMNPQAEERASAKPEAEKTATQEQNSEAAPAERPQEPDAGLAKLRQQFHRLGRELYGDQWDQVRHHNVERITAGQSTSANDLTAEQLQKLITGMKQLKRKRRTKRADQQQTQV